MTAWMGVVSADPVARGVERGVAQIGQGAGLARMRPGDTLTSSASATLTSSHA